VDARDLVVLARAVAVQHVESFVEGIMVGKY